MAMPVILMTDVPGLGQIGDKKNVKEGYARNYLIPRHLAVYATPNAINRAERQRAKIETKKNALLEEAKTLAEKVGKVGMVFERPVGHGGKLFGSVSPNDIMAEFKRQGATLEKKAILMNGPIKVLGDHTIRVRLHSQVVVDIPVSIKGINVGPAVEGMEETEEKAPEAEASEAGEETAEAEAPSSEETASEEESKEEAK